MGGLRLKQWAGFVGLLVCFATTGCGGTQTITQTTTVTETKTVTRTVVHHAKAPRTKTVTVVSTAPPVGGTSYPSAFAARFNAACANAGVYDPIFCHCALKYIEAHVPFSTVRVEGEAAFGATPPSWFIAAQNHCAGK